MATAGSSAAPSADMLVMSGYLTKQGQSGAQLQLASRLLYDSSTRRVIVLQADHIGIGRRDILLSKELTSATTRRKMMPFRKARLILKQVVECGIKRTVLVSLSGLKRPRRRLASG